MSIGGASRIASFKRSSTVLHGCLDATSAGRRPSSISGRRLQTQRSDRQPQTLATRRQNGNNPQSENIIILFLPTVVSQVDGRPPVLTATSQSNGNGQISTTHRIQTP